ncbi:MAG TPA: DUF3644 domain-containing protein [Candidatus Binataceae bacterium]|nr:DUF3644 domain-containing protein [Candidatus Binataceae bacterium]
MIFTAGSVRQRSTNLVEKSEAAMISAIEIYNKPDFKYREETFALLALNAWELLLKAKVLAENRNDPRAIQQHERHKKKDGTLSKKQYLKKTRSGNAHTISIRQAIVTLDGNASSRLDPAIKTNLDGLIEIRDNAAHYLNAGAQLAKQVLEIGTAAVRNYITLTQKWFKRDLSRYNLFLMPLGFLSQQTPATALVLNHDERSLIAFLASLAQQGALGDDPDYHVSLNVNLSFQRSRVTTATPVFVTADPSAPHVTISEEDIRRDFAWDYSKLTSQLSKRYIDFKLNQKYHDIRKPLIANSAFVKSRFLDPGNPRSAKKDFYNPNIIQVFDQHYTRKS